MRKNLVHENKARNRAKDLIRTTAVLLGCQVCGERDWSCLDFHHKDSSQKESDVRLMIKNKWGNEKIKGELIKCVPLCSNCHRKYHNGRLNYDKEFETIDPEFIKGVELIIKHRTWKDF